VPTFIRYRGENAGATEDEERLQAKLAMFVSVCKGWIVEAEERDMDGDVIEEVKQAHEHIREAFRILDE